ncbi:MAG: HD domain-containing protein [Desulfurococcales archaeon]|nr:HD domain-containing protein [Desulfurococcales archaeon]
MRIYWSSEPAVKSVYDELHGYIPLNEVELKIVDTPTFQRLRRIKQLAQAWYVYPGAVHTRFSHSLGVMYLMGIIASKLSQEGIIPKDDVQLLKLAALLHDIGHTPFSHGVEHYFIRKFRLKHEELSRWVIEEDPYITEILRSYGYEPREVAAIVAGLHKETVYNELLSSDLDVDRLDYLLRDALHTGVAYGLIDLDRIVQTVTVDNNGYIAVPKKAVQAVENFYIARLHMYRTVYYHKTITSYQLLIALIYEKISESTELRDLLEPFTTASGIRRSIRKGIFYIWDDFYIGGVLSYVLSKGIGDESFRELVRMYVSRRGFRAVYEWIGFSNVNPIPSAVRESINKAIEFVRNQGIPRYSTLPYVEVIPIVSDEETVRVLTNGSSVKITEFAGSIVKHLPESMGIARIYVHPMYCDAVGKLITKFLSHNIRV